MKVFLFGVACFVGGFFVAVRWEKSGAELKAQATEQASEQAHRAKEALNLK